MSETKAFMSYSWDDSPQRNHLFSQFDIHLLLEEQRKAVRKEVASIDENRLLNTNVDDLCAYFVKKYQLNPPVLLEDQIKVDQEETKIDVSNDFNRFISDPSRPSYVPGIKVILEVPYEGDPSFFRVKPRTSTTTYPVAAIWNNTLLLSVSGTDLTLESTKPQFDRLLDKIKNYLNWIADDVQPFNNELGALAREAIESRRQKLLAAQNLVASLGYPLKRRENALTTYAAPEVRRKAVPELPKASTAPFEPEPALDMGNYEHILKVVFSMVQVMERSPNAFQNMKEEDIRNHFLVQLNGQYEGNATGETFNLSGKSDILIRVQDRNIFIAECKFWSGPNALLETIDQILGYTNWRDTKTAILLFNRNKNFGRILEAIPTTVESHPKCKRQREYASETGFRFTLGHRDDENRELLLTILAFDVPN